MFLFIIEFFIGVAAVFFIGYLLGKLLEKTSKKTSKNRLK